MESLKPMKPMGPMQTPERWWSDGLGSPSASGAQNELRYAFFPDKKLLLIEEGGKLQKFDTGEHRLGGVSQGYDGKTLAFTSQHGPVRLDDLRKLS